MAIGLSARDGRLIIDQAEEEPLHYTLAFAAKLLSCLLRALRRSRAKLSPQCVDVLTPPHHFLTRCYLTVVAANPRKITATSPSSVNSHAAVKIATNPYRLGITLAEAWCLSEMTTGCSGRCLNRQFCLLDATPTHPHAHPTLLA